MSNANFTINAPQPLLTSPNGGETLQVQCVNAITWNSSTFFSNVRLDYSLDNGVTWINITTSTSNDGTQNWTVPATANSTQCKIKISNTADLNIFDVSDATFTIATPITITSPNGGENWIGCATVPITFTKSQCISYFDIYYSTNNGSTWNTITTYLGNNGLSSQTYNWQVPNGITSNQVLIKVDDVNYTAANQDVSNAVFNMTPSNDITVTSPNGAEVWQGLSTQAITWTNLPSASGQYTLQYSLNNGTNWTTIASNVTGNSYNWSVPNSPSTTCLIKVIDYVNTCKFDVSNANFTISPATPIVLTPNGGESYYAGTVNAITWNAATYFSSVRLDYSLDNGVTWINITTSTSNDGTQNWTVPNASSALCLIKVSNTSDLAVYDVSNANFTIKPAVTIITPNGNNGVTIWGGCTVTSITFDRSPAWSDYIIEYSLNNGVSWTSITGFWSTTANPATYNWTIPNTPTTQAKVRVTPYYATSNGDQSDNPFTITKPVTIIQPNFGGIMQIGTTYNIQWSSDGISNLYDIFYSTNGGVSFTNIVTGYNTSNNTYPWLVPSAASNNCRILVRDNINFCKADTSDIAFIISPTAASITLTSPNGIADTLYGCQTKTITWNQTSAIGNYNIAYSLNSGASWTNIVTNYATATNSYNWIVPNTISSSSVLLRVQSAANPTTIFDLSDAFFTILNGNLVATPSFTSVCTSVPVQLNATGGSNYSWSPAAGLSNPNISNPIATPSSTTTYIVQSTNGSCVLSDTVLVQVTTGGTTASVAISSLPTGSICAGTSVTFTATPQNEGTTPVYVWKVNGITVGTNSHTYTSTTLNNNDIVTCVMTSNLPCVAGSPTTSNAITMSVNPIANPSVTIQTTPSTTICEGTNITFTAIPVNGGVNPIYQWKLNGANVGSGGLTYSNAGLNNGDIITVEITANSGCATQPTASSTNTVITVNALPSTPGAINGNIDQCAGQVVTYSVPTIAGATSYQWTLPLGWTGSSTSNTINVTVGNNSGDISVNGVNSCGIGGVQTLSVNVNSTPFTPTSILGNTSICASSLQTYSVNPIVGATSYTWTLPNGWSGSSTTSSIDVTAGTNGGNITVTANNSCGSSAPQTINVSINNVPSAPGPIAGLTTVCAGANETYTVNSIAGATSYNWTLPNGWAGNSSNNSIDVVIGNAGGNITVTATFACGTSLPQTLAIAVQTTPVLSGNITGNNNVCDGGTSDYNILPVNGATNYIWSAPNDWTFTSNTNTVTMNVGSTSGNITLSVENSCGISNTLTLAVNVSSIPSQPAVITGNTTLCGGTSNTYSIPLVVGASGYTWSLPVGWTGTSTTNSIITIAGSVSGDITVTADNNCGSSTAQVITITTNNAPVLPSSISGSTVICENATETYSTASDPNATTYSWTLPNGWTGTSNTATIIASANTVGGDITVTASNSCGTSAVQTITVSVTNVPPTLDPIIGSIELCAGAATYSVPMMAGAASYDWTLPLGWTGTSTTNSINVITEAGTGTIEVSAVNGCGNSAPQTLNVNINALPNVILDISSIDLQCSNETAVTLIGGLPIGGAYAGNSVGAGVFNPSLAGVGSHVIQYSYTDSNSCSAFAYDTMVVDVCIGFNENLYIENNMSLYPNPGNGLINIANDGKVFNGVCDVFNSSGMIVKSTLVTSKNNRVDLSEFANGIYFLKFIYGEKVETVKYIKH
ncbi:MAG TPA: T9SS type A sorting domain-containing protein [Bacteroidia bacterium]|nr:T9SS type A sorting domain-containing protein [Bacteroidia bacterium]